MLEIFALIVLLVLCSAAIWLLVLIGNIPGNMARAANHPQGAGGTVAIYTDAGKPVHVISKVALRMSAWLAFLTSP